MGEVIPFSTKAKPSTATLELTQKPVFVEENVCDTTEERSCFTCRHALFGASGTFCRLYAIDVWDETHEAEGCEDYEQ